MNRELARERRRAKIRARIRGTAVRPRLVVTLSLTRTSAQLIDDASARTVAAVAEVAEQGTKTERAAAVGRRLAQAARAAGVTEVVFDRAGHPYRGRTRAVGEAAREGGLKF